MDISKTASDMVKILAPMVLEEMREKLEKYKSIPHGSKVKKGAFKDCTIELDKDGGKAFIVVNPVKGEVVWLTSENIRSFQFVKEKERLHNLKMKTYYYYSITFKDGSTSYVRMRKKYRNAMLKHTQKQAGF